MSRKTQTQSDDAQKRKPAPEAPGQEKSAEDIDEQLDQELEDSFPASDPPSLTQDPK